MVRAFRRHSWRVLLHVPLTLGLVILVLLVLAVLVPSLVAPADPEQRGPALMRVDGRWTAPPYAPGVQYPLGSDLQARDLLSRIVFGARTTLVLALLVSAVRITLGTLAGWALATFGGAIRTMLTMAITASATVPSLLFAFLVIAAIGPQKGLPLFLLALGLTGWAPWAQLISSGIGRIQALPYMEAARAIGSTGRSQVRNYLLPNLLPVVVPAIAQEIAASLLIVAELGFLGIFVGADSPVRLSDLLSGEQPQLPLPEWGGMLSGTRLEIFRWYWLPLVPAGAFLVTILSFNLLADGLREVLEYGQESA